MVFLKPAETRDKWNSFNVTDTEAQVALRQRNEEENTFLVKRTAVNMILLKVYFTGMCLLYC